MKLDQSIYYFFLFWYACGVILLSFDILPPALEWANVVFLIAAGIIGGIYFIRSYGQTKGLAISALIVFFSIFAEHLGVEYGILFGDYYYTQDFGPKLIGVPIAIGFAWLMVIASSHALAKVIAYNQNVILYVLTGSFLAVLMDLIIDPVAYEVKEYWVWQAESFYYNIPFSNFAGWFIVAFILHFAIYLIVHKEITTYNLWHSRMILVFGLIQAMFILLALINQLWLAVIMTATLTAIALAGYYLSLKRFRHDRSR
ncbi:carotenoid biosynthesis protein [Metabacillus idriensis]|uniref:carotenoid biosynthesis protein n=1 Tax=Metabacillus idriensis TaxID=324768 RepID=UPI002812E156|nr:carotenoid biosynthesis protein [Metabacillus idriensis]MDR0136396.1 carotenoid biosynthesis protein [Metabacillus idriensis]